MYIFLDTNIFYNNWYLKSADFKYLFNYLSNTGSTLLLSDVVCMEVENLRTKELTAISSTITSELKKAKKLNSIVVDFDLSKLDQPYNFKELVNDRAISVIFLPCDNVSQTEVLTRALKKIKPFQEEDKGYRDTLIWLSLIKYLKHSNARTSVVFITNNKNDFFSPAKTELHDDLKNDIVESALQCKILAHDSLYSFISKQIDKNKHEFTFAQVNEEFLQPIERDIEFDTGTFLENLQSPDFKKLLEDSISSFPRLGFVMEHTFTIWEGTEDAEVFGCERIDSKLLYIYYRYNLRDCIIGLTIHISDYENRKEELKNFFYNITVNDDIVTLEFSCRIYVDTSFNYSLESSSIDGLSINNFEAKIR